MTEISIKGKQFILICSRCAGHCEFTSSQIFCPYCRDGIIFPPEQPLMANLIHEPHGGFEAKQQPIKNYPVI